ncbi:MAG: hypothetical protein M0Z28_18195 [Rhodospirillales bacterium]|nr:hypothetical protein [Rhodospirillales bacterium]
MSATLPPGTRTMTDQSTMSTLEWILTAAVAAIIAAFGHAHVRINRVEDDAKKDIDEVRKAVSDVQTRASEDTLRGDKALHDLLDERERADRAFRERVLREMVTKDDWRQFSTEIRQFIRDLSGRTPPAA